MAALPWLNSKRLRDYPRLILAASWGVIILNILLSRGWIGGLTGLLMWGDFVDYYAAGKLYIHDIAHLYDPAAQESTQLSLIAPTRTSGFTFYSYPPNAALMHSALTHISLPLAIILWSIFSLGCVIISAYLITRYLAPDWFGRYGISTVQLSVIIFSSFAFTEGFVTGQMHSLTLLLIVLILIATKRENYVLAGLLAALSTFKPQFALGFLLLWFIWGKYKAILSFIASASVWYGAVLLTKGTSPFLEFLKFTNQMMYLPYLKEGFPIASMATPFSFVATILPLQFAPFWNRSYLVIGIVLVIFLCILAYRTRKLPMDKRNIVLAMAVILPILISPYALLHDLLILVPVLILFSLPQDQGKGLLTLSIGVYVALLILPLIGYAAKIALTALIPIGVFIYGFRLSLRLPQS